MPGNYTRVSDDAGAEEQVLSRLHPELSGWIRSKFGTLSVGQRLTIPQIVAGKSVLLSSPTGTGKTLAAFLGVFDHLVRARDSGRVPDTMVAVYVSPLRALAYDLQKNLQGPLDELGWSFVRVSSRTGDTSLKDRAAQKRKPPHILVTTPESLTLLLSQPNWVPAFKHVRFLILDELHALAESKRGSLLMVAAERLEEICCGQGTFSKASLPPLSDTTSPVLRSQDADAVNSDETRAADGALQVSERRSLVRIGLSATVSPLETMAEFLVGPQRACAIAEVTQRKKMKVELFSPLRANPYPPAGWSATRVMDELASLVLSKRTTLVFCNVRSGAENIGQRLKQTLPDLAEQIEVHHASLDRSIRLEVEDKLKRGVLRAVVCSTSLEMGIDIGSIDTVVMISAPKGVARALQRVGRSGHSMNETSHGVLVASNINDLVECTVTARMMERRELEPVKIHDNPLDVLAQHLVGLAVFGSVTLDEAYNLMRRAYPFRQLPREFFDRVVRYLEGGGASLERNYRQLFGKILLVDGVLTLPSPRVARDFYQNVGTIVAPPMIQVKLGRRILGEVEEWFIKAMRPGDVFVLNGRTVRLVETRLLTAKVTEAKSALPTIPRWGANKIPLGSGLAAEVVRLRTEVAKRLEHPDHTARDWLIREYDISRANAEAIVKHFRLQAQVSLVPTVDFFLIETYEERDTRHFFFHSLIGRSANDALSRIIAWRVQEAKGGNALVTIDDYGFLLSLRSYQSMQVDDWRALFRREGAEEALRLALADADLVKWQFRAVSQTGLMVPRRVRGEERGVRAMQWSAEIIFDVLRKYEPDHPLLQEAYAEATLRFLDTPRALAFLDTVGAQPWKMQPVTRVSPFSFGIYVSRIKETMMLEDPETAIERLYHEMYGNLEDNTG
jgi:ATP-dependent helicase Lhr and Lhr-like helicase